LPSTFWLEIEEIVNIAIEDIMNRMG